MEVAPDLARYQGAVFRFIFFFHITHNLFFQPNLKCTQFSKYKKEYEEKIAVAEANIDKAIADCSEVTAAHTKLSAEKNELVLALQSGGSAVQVIHHNVDF